MTAVYKRENYTTTDEAAEAFDDITYHGATGEGDIVASDLARRTAERLKHVWPAEAMIQYLSSAVLTAEDIEQLAAALPTTARIAYMEIQSKVQHAVDTGAMCAAMNDASSKTGEPRIVDAFGIQDEIHIARAVSEGITAALVRVQSSDLYKLPYQETLPDDIRDAIKEKTIGLVDIAGYVDPGTDDTRDMYPWERMISFEELDKEGGPGEWELDMTTKPLNLRYVSSYVHGTRPADDPRALTWKQFVDHVMAPRDSSVTTGRFNLIEAIMVCRKSLVFEKRKARNRGVTVEEGIFHSCPENHPYSTVVNVQRGGELYKIAELVCGIFNEMTEVPGSTMEMFTRDDMRAAAAAIALVSKSSYYETEETASLFVGNVSPDLRGCLQSVRHISTIPRNDFQEAIVEVSTRADKEWVHNSTNRAVMRAEKLRRGAAEIATEMQPRVSGSVRLVTPPSLASGREGEGAQVCARRSTWRECPPYVDQGKYGKWPSRGNSTRSAGKPDKWHSHRGYY